MVENAKAKKSVCNHVHRLQSCPPFAVMSESKTNVAKHISLHHCKTEVQNKSFFSSVAADLALRLGPDSERGRKVCKKYETLWLHQQGKSWRNQHNKKKHGNSDDTQISGPDLRFASRENSETTQNGAGATPNKKPHKSMGIASDTIGLSHGPNKLIGVRN